jgi:hypothetical protein
MSVNQESPMSIADARSLIKKAWKEMKEFKPTELIKTINSAICRGASKGLTRITLPTLQFYCSYFPTKESCEAWFEHEYPDFHVVDWSDSSTVTLTNKLFRSIAGLKIFIDVKSEEEEEKKVVAQAEQEIATAVESAKRLPTVEDLELVIYVTQLYCDEKGLINDEKFRATMAPLKEMLAAAQIREGITIQKDTN